MQLREPHSHPVGAALGRAIGTRPPATIVKQSLPQVVVEQLPRLAAMTRNAGGAVFLPVLQPVNVRQIAADATGEMGELNLQRGELVEQATVDDAHRRR